MPAGQVGGLHGHDLHVVGIVLHVTLGGLQAHTVVQGDDAQVLQKQQGAGAVGGVGGDTDLQLLAGGAAGGQTQRQAQGQSQCNDFFHVLLSPFSVECIS